MQLPTVRLVNTANPEEEIIVNASDVQEIVYSTQKTGFQKGRRYGNPRLFRHPIPTVSKVFIVGQWPNIAKAYEGIGIEVVKLDERTAREGPQEAVIVENLPIAYIAADPFAGYDIVLPDDWRSLPWLPKEPGGMTIRKLAKMISDVPVINSKQAVELIEAYEGRGR